MTHSNLTFLSPANGAPELPHDSMSGPGEMAEPKSLMDAVGEVRPTASEVW